MDVWDAYQALRGDRSENGRIPFTSIDCYARRYGIDDGDAFQRMHRLIVAMDTEFEKWLAEETSKPGEGQG